MRFLIAIIAFLVLPTIAISKTIYVPGDYTKIQEAVNAAMDGDVVLVAPGTYVDTISFKGKAITVKSSDGPVVTIVDRNQLGRVVSFVNGEDQDSVLDGFTITNGLKNDGAGIYCVSSCPIIKNNIIIHNTAKSEKEAHGGGICCTGGSPMITNNLICNNSAIGVGSFVKDTEAYGGGIFCNSSYPTIIDNTIMGNISKGSKSCIWAPSGFGGGITCNSGNMMIVNNVIIQNEADNGGGIECSGWNYPKIINNFIVGNNSVNGGGIDCSNDDAVLSGNRIFNNVAYQGEGGGIRCTNGTMVANNIITGNSADFGGGIFYTGVNKIENNTIMGNSANQRGGGICCGFGMPTIINSILWNNTSTAGPEMHTGVNSSTITISHSDVKGGKASVHVEPGGTLNWGPGMIDADPLFIDSADADFHLTFNSPCRASGDNTAITELYDFEGDPRIAYGTVDMGADEFYTHLYWTGDATPGGNVEIKFVGLPGTSPVGLCIGTGVLDPPIPSMWGDWYLQFPILGPIDLGKIPSPDGVLIIPGTIPGSPPPPYSIPMQALIGAELSNLCVLEVE